MVAALGAVPICTSSASLEFFGTSITTRSPTFRSVIAAGLPARSNVVLALSVSVLVVLSASCTVTDFAVTCVDDATDVGVGPVRERGDAEGQCENQCGGGASELFHMVLF